MQNNLSLSVELYQNEAIYGFWLLANIKMKNECWLKIQLS